MSDTCIISLTYRGHVAHRGIAISGESYGKTWTLSLAHGLWTLTDHHGEELHTFLQKDLHKKVAFPGLLWRSEDLYLCGLGPKVFCFEPEQEALDALKHFVELSERAKEPQVADG
jgi:hypothetical protein